MAPLRFCRTCGSSDLQQDILDFGTRHLNAFPLPSEPLPPTAPLRLALCQKCSLVQLGDVLNPDLFFKDQDFWYLSSLTQTMRTALEDVAESVRARVTLRRGDVVVAVGCNDGYELECYSPDLERIGFEPARNVAELAKDSGFVVVNDYFSAAGFREVSGRKAKVVQAIACMYDINDLNGFMADVRHILADDGVFVAQFTGLRHTIANQDIGNLTQEHCCFFTLKALEPLFQRFGLHIFDVEENGVNGGSLRVYASPRRGGWPQECIQRLQAEKLREASSYLADHKTFKSFSRAVQETGEMVRNFLRGESKAYVFGASTKANLSLQIWEIDRSLVRGVVDRDSRKHGREMATADRLPIVGEVEARREASAFLVMPLGFRQEFLDRESEARGRGVRFCFPVPEFEVL